MNTKLSTYIPGFYPGPLAMLAQLQAWNVERGWGIDESAFQVASIPAPRLESDDDLLLPIPRLLPAAGDVLERNFEEAYAVWSTEGAEKVSVPRHEGRWDWDNPVEVEFRLTPGVEATVPAVPGVEWVVFSPLGDSTGRQTMKSVFADPARVRRFAGLEVMWAAALMPNWLEVFDRLTHLPFIGGLQIRAKGEQRSEAWQWEVIGLEYWPNRGRCLGGNTYAGQYGYGFYYVPGLIYADVPLPTVRRLTH